MKGILLAGGRGTRLYPITRAISKQLLPVYDKPMFYYPLSTLMEADIRDILLISDPDNIPSYRTLLGDGSSLGISVSYAAQPFALGIADALRIGRNFSKGHRVALILGDNLFIPDIGCENEFGLHLNKAVNSDDAVIFTVPVENPQAFGVAEFGSDGVITSLEEKPKNPRSNQAVPGLYFYPDGAADLVDTLRPSSRGELEITDLNMIYLKNKRLRAISLPDSVKWLDTGSVSGLLKAVNLVASRTERGQHPGCIEQIAARKKFISPANLSMLADNMSSSDYGKKLKVIAQDALNT